MSSRSYTYRSSPVCLHCRNMELPFDDHWLRASPDPTSPIICPILLNTECRYCHEFGHTVGRCTKIKNVPVIAPASKKGLRKMSKPEMPCPIIRRGFSALESDSEEEEGEIREAIRPNRIVHATPTPYVKPKEQPRTVKSVAVASFTAMDFPSLIVLTKEQIAEVDAQIEARRQLFTSGKSWADICYLEDESQL